MRVADLDRLAGTTRAELPPMPAPGRAEPLFAAQTIGILADAQSQGGKLRGRAMELALSDPNALRAILRQAYPDANRFDLQRLEIAAARGELPLPARVRLVDRKALEGAGAAYDHRDGGKVLLADDLRGDPGLLQRAYAEEAGHHLDRWLGGRDSAGDEGAIFARGLLDGAPLADAPLALERADRDHGLLVLGGRAVRVEFYDSDHAGGFNGGDNPSDPGDSPNDSRRSTSSRHDGPSSGSDGASGTDGGSDPSDDGIGDARDGLDDDDLGFHMDINPEGPVSDAGKAWDAALGAVEVEDYATPEEKAEALKGAYDKAVDDQRDDGPGGEDEAEAPRLDVSATNRDELRAYFQGRLDYLDDNRPDEALAEDAREWEEDRALAAVVVGAIDDGALFSKERPWTRSRIGLIVQAGVYLFDRVMSWWDGTPSEPNRPEDVARVERELQMRGVHVETTITSPDMARYLEQEGAAAVTFSAEDIVVDAAYRYDVRTMREELGHVDQYREGLVGTIGPGGLMDKIEMEIDTRERMLADPWGLTRNQLREIRQEITDFRSGRRTG